MKLDELVEKLNEQQKKGYGNYEIFALATHDMIEPDGEITVRLCEHEIYIRGKLL